MLTAAEICNEVMGMSGFYPTGQYNSSTDQDDKLIWYLLRRAARDIAKYRWQELVRTGSIDITTGDYDYSLPADFREFIPGSIKTMNDLRLPNFPANFDEWSRVESMAGPQGVQHYLRLQQNMLTKPTSDDQAYTIRFDYISDNPVLAYGTTDVYNKTFETDGDRWILDDDLIIKGLKVKWSIEKRLDTLTADVNDYTSYLKELKGTQAGAQKLSFGRGRDINQVYPPYTNLWK